MKKIYPRGAREPYFLTALNVLKEIVNDKSKINFKLDFFTSGRYTIVHILPFTKILRDSPAIYKVVLFFKKRKKQIIAVTAVESVPYALCIINYTGTQFTFII